jgi:predicted DNA-binding transcriptional regulator AlpA
MDYGRSDRIKAKGNSTRSLAVNISDACSLTSISRSKFYLLMKDHSTPVTKVGRRTVVLVRDLENYLNDLLKDWETHGEDCLGTTSQPLARQTLILDDLESTGAVGKNDESDGRPNG